MTWKILGTMVSRTMESSQCQIRLWSHNASFSRRRRPKYLRGTLRSNTALSTIRAESFQNCIQRHMDTEDDQFLKIALFFFHIYPNIVPAENFPYVIYSRFIQIPKFFLVLYSRFILIINFINTKTFTTIIGQNKYNLTICESKILVKTRVSRIQSLSHLE